MNKYLTIILALIASILLILTIVFSNKHNESLKYAEQLEIEKSNLESDNSKLLTDIRNLKDEISELNEKLSKVKTFDTRVSSGSAYGNQPTAYTGNVIETKIDGEFEGWDGETIFKMMNGSIWQQASYAYTYHYAYMPDVIIYSKNGATYMKVEGVRDEIRVKRIR